MLNALKWLGTVCVILAAAFRAFEFHDADVVASIVGAGIWLYAAFQMKDKPLMAVNGFIAAVLIVGIIV